MLLIVFVVLYTALLLALIFSQGSRSRVNVSLALSMVAIVSWVITVYLLQTGIGKNIYFARSIFALGAVGLMSLLWFVFEITKTFDVSKGRLYEKMYTSSAYGIVPIVVLVAFTPLVVAKLKFVSNALPIPVYGLLAPLYILYMVLATTTVILILVKAYKRTVGVHHSQVKVIALSSLTAVAMSFITNLILPQLLNTSQTALYNPLTIIVLVTGLSYAMVKHKLFNIRFFAIRALAYSLTLLLIGLVYIAPLTLLLSFVLGAKFHILRLLLAVALTTLAAINYKRVQTWFNNVTSRIFLQDVRDPAELMSELNSKLMSTLDLRNMLLVSNESLKNFIKPEFSGFVIQSIKKDSKYDTYGDVPAEFAHKVLINQLKNSNQTVVMLSSVSDASLKLAMTENNVGLIARLNLVHDVKQADYGYIVLGDKRSGNPYGARDVQLLEAVVAVLAISMQNALHYEEIQNFNRTLEQQVEVATKKLKAANARLVKLDETKDEFVGMASHQLRTPLTSVKGYLSMVLEGDAGPLTPQQEDLLKQSYMSSQRMVNLIADLLNLSRLNTGKFVIDSTPTDLRMIVDQEVAQLRETAKAKQIDLQWDMPPTFSLVPLDENKLHQVVMNMIDNALYYTPEKGVVEVVLRETPRAVEFRVKDSGIGVPRELQRHLFTKFYRADNARRMRPDGTGLGLYMAKKVVVAQGGSIIFESHEGKGSTFGFRFRKEPTPIASVEVA